jgi:ethanolamine utilization protein EutN
MRIAQVVGTVTLSRWHPSFQGARLRLVVPLSLAELSGGGRPAAEELVAWDELAAGAGQWVALSEGSEAAQPFRPEMKPVDAYAAAILDRIDLHPVQP